MRWRKNIGCAGAAAQPSRDVDSRLPRRPLPPARRGSWLCVSEGRHQPRVRSRALPRTFAHHGLVDFFQRARKARRNLVFGTVEKREWLPGRNSGNGDRRLRVTEPASGSGRELSTISHARAHRQRNGSSSSSSPAARDPFSHFCPHWRAKRGLSAFIVPPTPLKSERIQTSPPPARLT